MPEYTNAEGSVHLAAVAELERLRAENAELRQRIEEIEDAAEELFEEDLEDTRGRMCVRHKYRVAMFCDKCFKEVMAERKRLLTLATKHCPRDHHDWQEILRIAGDAAPVAAEGA